MAMTEVEALTSPCGAPEGTKVLMTSNEDQMLKARQGTSPSPSVTERDIEPRTVDESGEPGLYFWSHN